MKKNEVIFKDSSVVFGRLSMMKYLRCAFDGTVAFNPGLSMSNHFSPCGASLLSGIFHGERKTFQFHPSKSAAFDDLHLMEREINWAPG